MATREEIMKFLKDGLGNVWADGRDGRHINLDDCATAIMKYLHAQGVGIRGLPLGVSHPHLSAYYTFEPLIEEGE